MKRDLLAILCGLAFILFFPAFAFAADVKIDAGVDQGGGEELQPINGTISITHDQNDKVDEGSILLGKDPLPVEFVQNVKVNPKFPLVISIYKFKLEGKPKGLHLLPEVSVKVGGVVYKSVPSSYEIGESKVQPAASGNKSILKLDAIVQAPLKLFPGQSFKVIYRYTFNDNIELTKEELPLLEGAGFRKIGSKEVNDSQNGAWSKREISQMFEAVKPGEYHFDPSKIEGFAYRTDPFGERSYAKPALHAETLPYTITVLPFPEQGKPPSFNGAVGPFSDFKVSMQTPSSVTVGDKVILDIDITGTGAVENAPLPELCCLPGFNGLFRQSDLPPVEVVHGNTKKFTVEMRPLSDNIQAIPPIQFSFFIPETSTYKTLTSPPIPLTVKPIPQAPLPAYSEKQSKGEAAPPEPSNKTAPIEITSFKSLQMNDLYNTPFGTWKVFWVIPIGVIVLALQVWLRRRLQQIQPAAKVKTSREIFSSALGLKKEHPSFYPLLTRAFMLRLAEKGLIDSPDHAAEELPSEGVAGEVRAFLTGIDEKRFTGHEQAVDSHLIKQAKALFEKI